VCTTPRSEACQEKLAEHHSQGFNNNTVLRRQTLDFISPQRESTPISAHAQPAPKSEHCTALSLSMLGFISP
jgi:hypothetical protein